MEYVQVVLYFVFGIIVGGKQMLGIGEMIYIGGNLFLQIFFVVWFVNCCQCLVIQGYQC